MVNGIRYEKEGRIGVVTLDRPEALNAMRRDMVAGLLEQLLDIERQADVRALIVTGEGRAFCAGVDLKETEADVAEEGQEIARDSVDTLQELTRVLMRLPMPTIAALNGLAVGMGSEISIACDIRVAAPQAYLWFSEAKRSLFQSNGVMFLLPRMIGYARSLEWMMSTRKIDSTELLASGLVAHVFDDEDFRSAALRYAERVAVNSPLSLRLLKTVGQKALAATYEEVVEMEADAMRETMESDYIREGLRAFSEGREPRY